ncbi:unnamed protein product [Gongylonema pulchrum]|uniref:Energy transducer TonB n=1 Tax=Gongylonema pulchrum TaxID=637853 RepID=A0A183DY03_9BILA|nr:unnamed protein product [Gongylonema pulchrum]
MPPVRTLVPPPPPPEPPAPPPDPEAELLKSNTDLNTKKFEPDKKGKKKKFTRKMALLIYVGALVLGVIVFNLGVAVGYFAL